MPSIDVFLANNKSMIIAPAGHGKTHTITSCVKLCNAEKKCLILTHTHAGIASIREKMKKEAVEPSKYKLETICGFALEYTNAFHINKDDIPDAENGSEYFDCAIKIATKLLQSEVIKSAISASFSHLIVDEYQDCTIKQHHLILAISNILPTHILGDPLQGIFGFRNNPLVDMNSNEAMGEFIQNIQELDIPWRWNNNNATALGQALLSIRSSLINNNPIDLNNHSQQIEIVIEPENNYIGQNSIYKQVIWHEINSRSTTSLLLIHPNTTSVDPRIKFIQQFPPLRLIESIDDKVYYKYAKLFDEKDGQNLVDAILQLMRHLSLKSVVNSWFRDNGLLKNKQSEGDQNISNGLRHYINALLQAKSTLHIASIIRKILTLPGNKCYRMELLNDLIKALESSHTNGISVYESIKKDRNVVRQQGRKIFGKCIGTTLLTKGLEFDVVIVLNAHKFDDPKHLYVAITRACKKLIIISQSSVILT